MLFASPAFLFVFLPFSLAAYFAGPSQGWRNAVLIAASLIFYAWGEPAFTPVLMGLALFNYAAALVIDGQHGGRRRLGLGVAVAVNLGLLAGFKYAGFLATNLNALLAAWVVEAMGRKAWSIDPAGLTWVGRPQVGDLPRMGGLPAASETARVFDVGALAPSARETPLRELHVSDTNAARPFILETGKAGPTVLIIGDSFTARPFFADFFARSAGRVAWVHMSHCAFDWAVIDRVKPDLILVAPVERYAHCDGLRPLGWR